MRVRTPRNALVFTIALAVTLGACASGGGGAARVPGASSTRIVKAELEPLGQVNALQAIERLRPRWTQTRSGEQPVLYVDGARRSSIQELSTMRIGDIDHMEYMSAGDATTRYGTGHGGGAILVTSVR